MGKKLKGYIILKRDNRITCVIPDLIKDPLNRISAKRFVNNAALREAILAEKEILEKESIEDFIKRIKAVAKKIREQRGI